MQRFNYKGRWMTLEQYQQARNNEPVEDVIETVEAQSEPVEPQVTKSKGRPKKSKK
jgi:hypothetical protein